VVIESFEDKENPEVLPRLSSLRLKFLCWDIRRKGTYVFGPMTVLI
jgi:hypothetical protein